MPYLQLCQPLCPTLTALCCHGLLSFACPVQSSLNLLFPLPGVLLPWLCKYLPHSPPDFNIRVTCSESFQTVRILASTATSLFSQHISDHLGFVCLFIISSPIASGKDRVLDFSTHVPQHLAQCLTPNRPPVNGF